jgi:hypothetical protein
MMSLEFIGSGAKSDAARHLVKHADGRLYSFVVPTSVGFDCLVHTIDSISRNALASGFRSNPLKNNRGLMPGG